jgi:hypothetical protein
MLHVVEFSLDQCQSQRLGVPHRAMTMEQSNLRQREKGGWAARPFGLNKRPITTVRVQVFAEIRHPDPDQPAWSQYTAALPKDADDVSESEVLQDVLKEDGMCAAVRKWNTVSQIPQQVGPHTKNVDIDPTVEPVHARPEMEAKVRASIR